MKLNGIFAPLITPFLGDEVDYKSFTSNLYLYNKIGLKGYIIAGSSGESALLTDNEIIELTNVASSQATDKIIIAGTGRESTLKTINLTKQCANVGARYALVRSPAYFHPLINSKALKEFYLNIAEASSIPIIIYNIPKFTGTNIEADLVVELSKHPNIAGIKDSSGTLDILLQTINRIDKYFEIVLGAGGLIFPALLLGASGGILALADVAPKECVKIYEYVKSGNLAKARELQLRLYDLNLAITSKYGIAGLKYAVGKMGFKTSVPRGPIMDLSYNQKIDIDKIIKLAKVDICD